MAKKVNHRVTVKISQRGVTKMDHTIGLRLRSRRLEMHMSQDHLAGKLGISFQQVQKYEKGVNRVGSARLVQIADILECDPGYFLAGAQSNGGKAGVTQSRFAEFMATSEGLAINEAMVSLNHEHRQAVIDLARTLVRAYGE